MQISFYGKRAIKWLVISLVLFAVCTIVREVAWTGMLAGGSYVVSFSVLLILGMLGTIALGVAIYFALLTV
jgi:hypothetical protein